MNVYTRVSMVILTAGGSIARARAQKFWGLCA